MEVTLTAAKAKLTVMFKCELIGEPGPGDGFHHELSTIDYLDGDAWCGLLGSVLIATFGWAGPSPTAVLAGAMAQPGADEIDPVLKAGGCAFECWDADYDFDKCVKIEIDWSRLRASAGIDLRVGEIHHMRHLLASKCVRWKNKPTDFTVAFLDGGTDATSQT